MAASNEWTDWHLTPQGWVRGSEKTDFDQTMRDPPQGRVMTMRWSEHVGHHYGKAHRSAIEKWRSHDSQAVEELLKTFGPSPEAL